MNKKVNLKNTRKALIIFLIITSIPLFFINGQIWVFNWFIVWNFIVAILFVVYMSHLYNKSKKKPKKEKPSKIIVIIGISYLIIAPFIIAFFSFPIASIPVKYIRAEFNKGECERIVEGIITDYQNETEKTVEILNWFERFSGNFYNTYGSVEFGPLYFGGGIIFDNMLCVRLDDRQPALWALTSRCGACGEHGALFTSMAHQAGFQVRTVVCSEIDHVWSEVKINDTWIIMDPANVDHSRNMSGYNISAESFERKHAHRTENITYVFAEYPDGTKKDITNRYTNLTKIDISTVDEYGNPLQNIDLSIISYNRFREGADTGYTCQTAEDGKYQLEIGGGDIKIVAQSSDIIPLYGETRDIYYDNENHNVQIVLHSDWTKNYYLIGLLIIICFATIIYIFIYYWRKKHG